MLSCFASKPKAGTDAAEPAAGEYMFAVASHGVPDWDAWKATYDKLTAPGVPAEEGGVDHAGIGVVRTIIGCQTTEDSSVRTVVIHVFKKSCLEAVKGFFDFTAPPFVGGPDLIKNGAVIAPCEVEYFDVVQMDSIMRMKQNSIIYYASHGVPEFNAWLKLYHTVNDGPDSPEEAMGGAPLLIGKRGGKEDTEICVVGTCPAASKEIAQGLLDMEHAEPLAKFRESGDLKGPYGKLICDLKAIDRSTEPQV